MDELLCLLDYNGDKISELVILAMGKYDNVVRGHIEQALNLKMERGGEAKHTPIIIHQENQFRGTMTSNTLR